MLDSVAPGPCIFLYTIIEMLFSFPSVDKSVSHIFLNVLGTVLYQYYVRGTCFQYHISGKQLLFTQITEMTKILKQILKFVGLYSSGDHHMFLFFLLSQATSWLATLFLSLLLLNWINVMLLSHTPFRLSTTTSG